MFDKLPAGLAAALIIASVVACSDESLGPSLEQPDTGTGTGTDSSTIGDGGVPPADAAKEPSQWQPPVACGTVLPGPPMRSNLVEAQPGYAATLAGIDTNAVADPIDLSKESKFIRGVVNYMLQRGSGNTVTRAEALAAGGMGQAVLAAAARGKNDELDVPLLRQGFHYFYQCSRPTPFDLTTLRSRYGNYESWESNTVACAKPKNGPRRFFRNPRLGIYVAETLVAGQVRETEVLFDKLRADGQLDFAAYTAEGQLSDRSSFATGGGGTIVAASPYTCMSCHVDNLSSKFNVLVPSGTGAGCR